MSDRRPAIRARVGRGRSADEGGFSLPELLVTITLMAIVSAGVIASAVAIQRSLGTADATLNDMSANRIGIERVGSLLRGAVGPTGRLNRQVTAGTEGSAQSITFYTVTGRRSGQAPVQVTLALQMNGDLTEVVLMPTPDLLADLAGDALPAYPPNGTPRVIVRDIRNTDLFRYWSHAQVGTAVATRCGRLLTATPALSAADRRTIDSVQFRLVLQEERGYDSAPSDLQGWARFASSTELGYSGGFESAGCLDDPDSGFRYDDVYGTP